MELFRSRISRRSLRDIHEYNDHECNLSRACDRFLRDELPDHRNLE
jgi:hypothetical protein